MIIHIVQKGKKNMKITSTDEKAINVLADLSTLSDVQVEANYKKIESAIKIPDATAVLDFRRMKWFEIWALIQVLCLFDCEKVKKKRRIVLVNTPEVLGQLDKTLSNKNISWFRILARLRFLSEIGFLERTEKMGFELWLQRRSDLRNAEKVSVEEIAFEIAKNTGSDEDPEIEKRIIPITKISDLRLRETRDRLFARSKEVFGRFSSEAIVEEAGLGDCLLQEIVSNVEQHGSQEGYVALRAVPGLRRMLHNDPAAYKRAKYARTHHSLGDWKNYFNKFPDDAYFELVVVDKGPGIVNTIQEDENLPREILESPQTLADVHARISYALRINSSRFSEKERKARDLTSFTGLGAVDFVLNIHGGSLFIRENKSRHIFVQSNNPDGDYFERINLHNRKLAAIPGVSVTAVIPMRRTYHPRSRFELIKDVESEPNKQVLSDEDIIKFRVRRKRKALSQTLLDKNHGLAWATIASRINKFEAVSKVVLIDVEAAQIEKNELWSGLVRVFRACTNRKIPLFLCGLSLRQVWRLEEYIELDKKRIAVGEDWLFIGLGDNAAVYCLG